MLNHALGAAAIAVKRENPAHPELTLSISLLKELADLPMLTTSFFSLCFSQTSSFCFQDFSKAEKNHIIKQVLEVQKTKYDGPLKRSSQILLFLVRGTIDPLVMTTNKPMFSFINQV